MGCYCTPSCKESRTKNKINKNKSLSHGEDRLGDYEGEKENLMDNDFTFTKSYCMCVSVKHCD